MWFRTSFVEIGVEYRVRRLTIRVWVWFRSDV